MYRFLDRDLADLDEPHLFLLAAIRNWVECARAGRCPCAVLGRPFVKRGIPDALGDFTLGMAALDRDGVARLSLGRRTCLTVHSDEARLLALFDAGLSGQPARTRRIAATLVRDDAVAPLALAAERVGAALADHVFVERDR